MNQSQSISKLAAALVAAQKEMPVIPKSAENPFFKSQYASLDCILELVKPILCNHGLTVIQGSSSPVSDAEGRITGFVGTTMLLHESGEWVETSLAMPLAKSDPQGMGSAVTYFKRYGVSALLNLATEEDDDANHASTPSTPQPARAPENRVMPFGKPDVKGKTLGEIPTAKLTAALKWCQETDAKKFADLIGAIESVLENRRDNDPGDYPNMGRDEGMAA